MLAGIPNEYHISCRVRSSLTGIDADTCEHADYVIEAATPMAALAIWLAGESYKEKAWLRCSADDLKRLLALPKNDQVDFSTSSPGADGCIDWDVHEIYTDEGAYVVELYGTANLSEFEFEIRISPVSKQEITSEPLLSSELSRPRLVRIVEHMQNELYRNEDGVWTLDKEVSGGDFVDSMGEILRRYGLAPGSE